MNSALLSLKQDVQSLLKEYREFAYGLSADNPFSRYSIDYQLPKFKGRTRAMNCLFNLINPNALSYEDLQLYREVDSLLDDLNEEVF